MALENDRGVLDLELPGVRASVPTARRAIERVALDAGAEPDDIALAVSEAVANAVLHAFEPGTRGTIRVTARRKAGILNVCVADDGRGMTPKAHSSGLGVGLGLITRLARDASIRSSAQGTVVSMRFEIPAAA